MDGRHQLAAAIAAAFLIHATAASAQLLPDDDSDGFQCDPHDPICYPPGGGGRTGGTSGPTHGPAIPPSAPNTGPIGNPGGSTSNDTGGGVVCETKWTQLCTGEGSSQRCWYEEREECTARATPGNPGGTGSGNTGERGTGGGNAGDTGNPEDKPQISPRACRNAACCTQSGFRWRTDIKTQSEQGTCLADYEIDAFCDDLDVCERSYDECKEQITPNVEGCYNEQQIAASYSCGYRWSRETLPGGGRVRTIAAGGHFGLAFDDNNRIKSGLQFAQHQLCGVSGDRVRLSPYFDATSDAQCTFRCMENRERGFYGAATTNLAVGFGFDYQGFGLGLEFSRDVPGYQATTKGYIELCNSRVDPLKRLCDNDYSKCLDAKRVLQCGNR